MTNKKTYFFGWTNIKRLIKELVKVFSNEPSFFSQKRIQQNIAFGVLEWGAIYYLVKHSSEMSTSDFLIWSSIQATIVGYILNHVQKEKKDNTKETVEFSTIDQFGKKDKHNLDEKN